MPVKAELMLPSSLGCNKVPQLPSSSPRRYHTRSSKKLKLSFPPCGNETPHLPLPWSCPRRLRGESGFPPSPGSTEFPHSFSSGWCYRRLVDSQDCHYSPAVIRLPPHFVSGGQKGNEKEVFLPLPARKVSVKMWWGVWIPTLLHSNMEPPQVTREASQVTSTQFKYQRKQTENNNNTASDTCMWQAE